MAIDKKIGLTDKWQEFVDLYCNNGHNASKAYSKAYPDNKTPDFSGSRLLSNVKIKDAIEQYKANNKAKIEHDQEIALKELADLRLALVDKLAAGNIMAIRADLAILAEMNKITGLQSITTVYKGDVEPDSLSEAERLRLKRVGNILLRSG